MRPAIKRGAWLLGMGSLLVVSVGISAAAGQVGVITPQCVALVTPAAAGATNAAQHPQRDARTNAAFLYSLTRDNAVRVTVNAGGLDVDKTIYPGGRSRIVLRTDNDRVSVGIGVGIVDIERRNGGRVRLDVAQASDDDWLKVRTLLAGSEAMRLFRNLAYNLADSTRKHPGGAAIVLSDAVVGYLDGDVAAIGRFIQQSRPVRQAGIHTVRLGGEEPNPCWDEYQKNVTQAADEYDQCRHSFEWYDPRQALCVFVWTLQAESAWARFLACSGIPVKAE